MTAMTNETVNYEIWIDSEVVKTYPDLPNYCWEVAQRLRRRYEAAGVVRTIRLCRVTHEKVPFNGGFRDKVKERRVLIFSHGVIYNAIKP